MTAMLVNADREFVCATVPAPVRKDGEGLIEIHAAAVNRADLMQREGNYPPPPGWPEWCGLEVAGIVLEAPPSASVRPGEQVCALLGGGGYAEQVAVPAGMVIPIPAGISMVEAATLPEVWSTFYQNKDSLSADAQLLLPKTRTLAPNETIRFQPPRTGAMLHYLGTGGREEFLARVKATAEFLK